ncbi:MAG: 50S ribosomal protein L23 [Bacteroidales bacterium OttesenSCG-928-I14]|nr:50S ribosomal protein L23 [Bacteroidales bacterium OttesenSCG-928-I14]
MLIIKPIVTEKQTKITDKKSNCIGFRVYPNANKLEIKKVIKELYDVSVIKVNTMNYSCRKKFRYTKTGVVSGWKKSFKKAIVMLKNGETIDFYGDKF